MSAKAERTRPPAAQRLARELKAGVWQPGLLARLCQWEKQRQRAGQFRLQHRHD